MAVFEEVRTITADGRLVVPWAVQLALGLEHGGPVRFRVEDGAVALLAVKTHQAGTARELHGADPRTASSKSVLMAELRTLLEIADRDRASEASSL